MLSPYLLCFLSLVVLGKIAASRAFFDFFAIFKVAADGAVTTRHYFLSILQPLKNLPMRIITDANLDRDHFCVISVQKNHYLNRLGGFLGLLVSLDDVRPIRSV